MKKRYREVSNIRGLSRTIYGDYQLKEDNTINWENLTQLGSNVVVPEAKLLIPKKVAEIKLCGALHFSIDETMGFIMPTEEQRKNLKETFCIEVIPAEELMGD